MFFRTKSWTMRVSSGPGAAQGSCMTRIVALKYSAREEGRARCLFHAVGVDRSEARHQFAPKNFDQLSPGAER